MGATRPLPRALGAATALAAGVALGAAIYLWALAPARVSGDSMLPALSDGDVVLLIRPGLDRLLGGSGGTAPGDVVALISPFERTLIVKRVVAGAGASVVIDDGVVRVDGAPVGWGSEELRGGVNAAASVVPPESVYVLGDNRLPLASRDSRSFGPVPLPSLRGRVVLALRLGR